VKLILLVYIRDELKRKGWREKFQEKMLFIYLAIQLQQILA
jgi:hypothetical protein